MPVITNAAKIPGRMVLYDVLWLLTQLIAMALTQPYGTYLYLPRARQRLVQMKNGIEMIAILVWVLLGNPVLHLIHSTSN